MAPPAQENTASCRETCHVTTTRTCSGSVAGEKEIYRLSNSRRLVDLFFPGRFARLRSWPDLVAGRRHGGAAAGIHLPLLLSRRRFGLAGHHQFSRTPTLSATTLSGHARQHRPRLGPVRRGRRSNCSLPVLVAAASRCRRSLGWPALPCGLSIAPHQ